MACHRCGGYVGACRYQSSGHPVDRPTVNRSAHPAPFAGFASPHAVSRTLQVHSTRSNLARFALRVFASQQLIFVSLAAVSASVTLRKLVIPIVVRLRMRRERSSGEGEALQRRRWPRLALAIPVFVRGEDAQGKDFIEFSTLLNESAGGALLAIRRSLRASSRISLEIPSAPHAASAAFPPAVRMLRARVVRITHLEGWHLCGVQFVRPIGRAPRPGVR